MVTAISRPKPDKTLTQTRLFSELNGDYRLLEPGFAGELGPDEFNFILESLLRDKKLSFSWGFQPARKRRPEWSIRQVAEWGDPDRRATNMELARQKMSEIPEVGA